MMGPMMLCILRLYTMRGPGPLILYSVEMIIHLCVCVMCVYLYWKTDVCFECRVELEGFVTCKPCSMFDVLFVASR